MQTQERIEKLARDKFYRAVRESAAGVFVLVASAYSLQNSAAGSARFYGNLLTIIAVSFILGVVWSFTISRRVVRHHSAADTAFWREAFETQARLLRFAPLWYVAPLAAGILLAFAPTQANEFASFLLKSAGLAALCGAVIYINKVAANQLETEAAEL